MKILYLSSWYPYPPDNGSRIRAFHLLKGLAQSHDVTLVAFIDPDQSTDTASELYALPRRVITLPRRIYQPKRARALVALLSPQPRSLVDTFDADAQKVIQESARDNFDAIIACQLSMAVYARSLAHPAKIFDEVETGVFADAYAQAHGLARFRNGLTWFKYARYLKTLARDFNALTVVSPVEQARLARIGIESNGVHLVPNGVDCSAPETHDRPREPFTLIYNGALSFVANYDAMRYFVGEILPQVRSIEPRVKLKITGRAPQFAINELSQDNAVSFTGYVTDVRAEVQSSAVCIVPLREGGGTRLKILEAMAVGTPVVSTSKGAEGLGLENGKHLLVADTPQAFAQATIRLVADPMLGQRLARAARARVCAEYDWGVIQSRMAQVLARVVGMKQEG